MKKELLETFATDNVITEKNFSIFHGGGMGGDYVDLDSAFYNCVDRAKLSNIIFQHIIEDEELNLGDYDALAFLDKDYGPVGMLPYATEIANRLEIPAVIIRLNDRIRLDHMKVKGVDLIHAHELEDDNILLIDDVITTGNTQKDAIEIAKEWGAEVNGVLAVYSRESDKLSTLKKKNDSLEYAKSILTYLDCLSYGLVLSDDPDDYNRDYVDYLQDLYDLSDEDAERMREELDGEVEDVIRHALESILDEKGLVDNPDEKQKVLDELVSEFDGDLKDILKTYLPVASDYVRQKRIEADD